MFGFVMSKEKAEIEKKRIEKIIECVRNQAIVLNDMIQFIKDYGNLTKRKNNKLRRDDFFNIKNNILTMPISLNVALHIIQNNKKLTKMYNNLMQKVEAKLRKEMEEIKKKELKEQIRNKIIKGN